ncbi:MAG: cell envelope integrity protein CreD [Deltaproteobacteria bacterium]|nr:cell envelope integrity protein CreD [Deltaproteobacteria bacterium]
MENKDGINSLLELARSSRLLRIILVGFLILLLQIPIEMIKNSVHERQARRQEAIEEVTSKWGVQQSIIGPLLYIPYLKKISETDKDGVIKMRTELKHGVFLPDDLQSTGNLNCEVRYRGIFKIPVYSTELDITGQFTHPDFSEWGVDPNDILWDRAHLTLRISDARAITNQAALKWNGEELNFLPGVGDFGGRSTGIHVPMRGRLSGDAGKFSFHLNLNGSEGIFFVPFGRETTVEIKANWNNPSFQGNWLPAQRTINNDGFQAKWSIPFLGRNFPQKWKSETAFDDSVSSALFGVRFITPVDHYRMSERSIKYEFLFLSLTFITLWLFEVLIKVRIHSIQYLLVGAGMCIFYLLELSLAEHIGFLLAYICATLAVTSLIFFYCIFVLGGYKRSSIISLVILFLYGYLYILLMNQDYALLIGSICLFMVLAAIMYITRKVDWYSMKS